MPSTEVVLDDEVLLLDRLMRSLHKNSDGHLSSHPRGHQQAISSAHNIAVLYVYTLDAGAYMMHEHYVFSHEPQTYKQWLKLVLQECETLHESNENVYGVFGWLTSFMHITPLREGDLFIKIDKEGARGVRLTFSTRKSKRNAHAKA